MVRTSRRLVSALCSSAVVSLLAGCGMGSIVSNSVEQAGPAATYTLSGTVHMPTGTRAAATGSHVAQVSIPVSGANVFLYAAGTTGYGSTATLLAATKTSTDGGASFSFVQDAGHANSTTITNTYKCPTYVLSSANTNAGNPVTQTTADSLIYLVAFAGDTQDTVGSIGNHTNSGAVLMAALGPCTTVGSQFVNINEVTTVASVTALAPYMSPIYPTGTFAINGAASGSTTLVGGAVGTSLAYQTGYGTARNGGYLSGGTNGNNVTTPLGLVGLRNAFATVRNLVTIATGAALPGFSNSATLNSNPVTVTGTPETAKINTLANALSTCIASSNTGPAGTNLSTACTNLFASTPAPLSSSQTSLGAGVTFPAAADTLQAMYYIATNPTNNTTYGANTAATGSNLGKVYALGATSTANYQPYLTAQPTDWTIGITYSSASSCGTDGTPSGFFNSEPWTATSDLNGDVFLANGAAANNTFVGLSPTGVPLACQFGAKPYTRSASMDINGNNWAATNAASTPDLFYLPSNGGAPTIWPAVDGNNNSYIPYGVVADGIGNVFFTAPAGSVGVTASSGTAGGALLQFPLAAVTPTTVTTAGVVGTPATTANGAAATTSYSLYYLAVDPTGNIFSPSSGGSTTTAYVWAALGNNTYSTLKLSNTGISTPYGAAAAQSTTNTGAGNIDFLFGNTCCSSAYANADERIPVTGAGGSLAAGTLVGGTKSNAGVIGVRSVAVDGAGNIWTGNYAASTSFTNGSTATPTCAAGATCGVFGVGETDALFNSLSSNGPGATTCSTTGNTQNNECNTGGGYVKSTIGASRGLLIDLSGNVWVPSDLSTNTGSAAATSGYLVEIVGAAVPVIQPLAIAARDNKVTVKP